jgi:transcriptional regulator with XRE-family HTH domain
LFTAAQFLRSPASIFSLDFFAVCFIMVLCKLNFAWTIKKSAKQPIFAQKQPIFGLQKSRYPIKSGEKDMTLCEKLTQARKAAGLTQADVAAKLNVSRQAVSRWESGQSKPSTEKLLALGELYGVSIDRLLNTENVDKPVVETSPDLPEAEPLEPVISEKRHPRTLLKYAAAVFCGVIVTLFIVCLLSKSGSIGKKRPKSIEGLKTEDTSSKPESYFDFTWD